MKKLYIILTALALLAGCSDDDKDVKLTVNFLKQTAWKGTIINPNPNSDVQDETGVEFLTEDSGHMALGEIDGYERRSYFNYKINGNSIYLGVDWPVYKGHWLLKEIKKNKLVLVHNAGSSTVTYIMTLEKVL